jgi:hypothetical protein
MGAGPHPDVALSDDPDPPDVVDQPSSLVPAAAIVSAHDSTVAASGVRMEVRPATTLHEDAGPGEHRGDGDVFSRPSSGFPHRIRAELDAIRRQLRVGFGSTLAEEEFARLLLAEYTRALESVK